MQHRDNSLFKRLITVCYGLAVVFVCLTICNETVWNQQTWTPPEVSIEPWQGPVRRLAAVNHGSRWLAQTSTGAVMMYGTKSNNPEVLLRNDECDSFRSLVHKLCQQTESSDDWLKLQLTTFMKSTETIVERNAKLIFISMPEHTAGGSSLAHREASIRLISRKNERIVRNLPWMKGATNVSQIIPLEDQHGLIVAYDSGIELIRWNQKMKVSRELLTDSNSHCLVYEPSKQMIVFCHNRDHMSAYSLAENNFQWTICLETNFWASALAVDTHNDQILIGLPTGTVFKAKLLTGEICMQLRTGHKGVSCIAIDESRNLLVGLYDGTIERWDLETESLSSTHGLHEEIHSL